MSDAQRVVNLADVPLKDSGNGKSFQARIGRIGPMLGLTGLGCTFTVVAPVHSIAIMYRASSSISCPATARSGLTAAPCRFVPAI